MATLILTDRPGGNWPPTNILSIFDNSSAFAWNPLQLPRAAKFAHGALRGGVVHCGSGRNHHRGEAVRVDAEERLQEDALLQLLQEDEGGEGDHRLPEVGRGWPEMHSGTRLVVNRDSGSLRVPNINTFTFQKLDIMHV
jgi:hypothetical protein